MKEVSASLQRMLLRPEAFFGVTATIAGDLDTLNRTIVLLQGAVRLPAECGLRSQCDEGFDGAPRAAEGAIPERRRHADSVSSTAPSTGAPTAAAATAATTIRRSMSRTMVLPECR